MRPRRILFFGRATGRVARWCLAGAATLAVVACETSSPTAPTPAGPDVPASSASSLTGVVTDPASLAVAGAEVEIVEGIGAGRRVSTNEQGRYMIDGLDAGALAIAVSADGFARKQLNVEVSGATHVDVQLPPAATNTEEPPDDDSPVPDPDGLLTIRGRILTETSMPATNAHIEITTGANAGRDTGAAPDGTYSLAELHPGAMTVVAGAAGYISQTRAIEFTQDATMDFALVPAHSSISGVVTDAVSGSGVAGVEIDAEGVGTATSDQAGGFRLNAAIPDPMTTWLRLRGAGIVERQTRAHVPGDDVEVSVIPASFDLNAFDEMFRAPALRRWREAPRLLIERRTVAFSSEAMATGVASGDPMTDLDVNSLVTDLTWALPQLSGDHFSQFAGVALRVTDAGADATLLNDDVITVARVSGLTEATGFWGFSRWQSSADGTVTAGLIMIDADFDAGSSPYRRALRAHELGHALGYQHVSSRPSVMNASARLEPTDFDRQACDIAFEREPGNRTPDIDPVMATVNRHGPRRWSRPIR